MVSEKLASTVTLMMIAPALVFGCTFVICLVRIIARHSGKLCRRRGTAGVNVTDVVYLFYHAR